MIFGIKTKKVKKLEDDLDRKESIYGELLKKNLSLEDNYKSLLKEYEELKLSNSVLQKTYEFVLKDYKHLESKLNGTSTVLRAFRETDEERLREVEELKEKNSKLEETVMDLTEKLDDKDPAKIKSKTLSKIEDSTNLMLKKSKLLRMAYVVGQETAEDALKNFNSSNDALPDLKTGLYKMDAKQFGLNTEVNYNVFSPINPIHKEDELVRDKILRNSKDKDPQLSFISALNTGIVGYKADHEEELKKLFGDTFNAEDNDFLALSHKITDDDMVKLEGFVIKVKGNKNNNYLPIVQENVKDVFVKYLLGFAEGLSENSRSVKLNSEKIFYGMKNVLETIAKLDSNYANTIVELYDKAIANDSRFLSYTPNL